MIIKPKFKVPPEFGMYCIDQGSVSRLIQVNRTKEGADTPAGAAPSRYSVLARTKTGADTPAGAYSYEGPSGVSYILSEGFEDTGYENAVWSEQIHGDAVVDEDNTDYSLQTGGSQGLYVAAATNDDATMDGAVATLTAMSHFYFYFLFEPVISITNDHSVDIFSVHDASNVQLFSFFRSSNTYAYVWDGSTSTGGTFVIAVDTLYHVWGEFQNGSGTAYIKVYLLAVTNQATDAKPAVTINATGKTITGTAVKLKFVGIYARRHVFDKIRIDDVDIGNCPIT